MKATITYMRGSRMPQDTISWLEIPLTKGHPYKHLDALCEAFADGQIPDPPPNCTQVRIVIGAD